MAPLTAGRRLLLHRRLKIDNFDYTTLDGRRARRLRQPAPEDQGWALFGNANYKLSDAFDGGGIRYSNDARTSWPALLSPFGARPALTASPHDDAAST